MSVENKNKFDSVFCQIFGIESKDLNENLKYNTIAAWDSIAHMTMIAELEETFNIVFETDDIVNFSSYEIGKGILQKYGINAG